MPLFNFNATATNKAGDFLNYFSQTNETLQDIIELGEEKCNITSEGKPASDKPAHIMIDNDSFKPNPSPYVDDFAIALEGMHGHHTITGLNSTACMFNNLNALPRPVEPISHHELNPTLAIVAIILASAAALPAFAWFGRSLYRYYAALPDDDLPFTSNNKPAPQNNIELSASSKRKHGLFDENAPTLPESTNKTSLLKGARTTPEYKYSNGYGSTHE